MTELSPTAQVLVLRYQPHDLGTPGHQVPYSCSPYGEPLLQL